MHAPASNLASLLANSSLFGMLDEEHLARLAAHTSVLRLDANSRVVAAGDRAAGTFWIVYGQVKIGVNSRDGCMRVIAILGAAKCFGLGEMLHDQPYLASVSTTDDSMLLHVEREAMLEAARDNFAFACELMQCMGRQYYTLMRDLGESIQSARLRLAGYLLRHAQPNPSEPVELVASKAVIASRLNVTPETMSRLLREFSYEGLIEVTGRRITVLDWDRMAALV
ncbi:MAG TPA: Crp/Fnr family transcriptional regulator [Telluria sp.]|nr:Crp/Fnr family transcriptional regulator [Telluria sp.]